MHYATGEVAQVSDVVRGKVGDRVVVGQVLELMPEAETCNVVVVHDGKPARLSNSVIVLDGAKSSILTTSDLELLVAAPSEPTAASHEEQNAAGVGSGG